MWVLNITVLYDTTVLTKMQEFQEENCCDLCKICKTDNIHPNVEQKQGIPNWESLEKIQLKDQRLEN